MLSFLARLPILKRLIPSIGCRILKLLKKNVGFYKIGKVDFFLDFLDPIDRQIIIHKKYEEDQILFLEDQIKQVSFDYFFDIGANSGYYSFYFAEKFNELKVISFELNFLAFYKFKKTLSKNLFNNVKVFNFGLSDQKKKVNIASMISHNYIHSNSTIVGDNQEHNRKLKLSEAYVEIGDHLYQFSGKKILFKIDVEGHEIYTLKGLIKNLSSNNCLILIEISNHKFDEVFNFFTQIGFKKIFKSKFRHDYVFKNF